MRVLVFGATGTIGRATVAELKHQGHHVLTYGRKGTDLIGAFEADVIAKAARGADAVISCLASRTGAPREAWAIDHDAHQEILKAVQQAGVGQFVLLSAICVQKPKLAFQRAKLAFEDSLMGSGLRYSIVRPTAYFKSLAGQIARVQSGKPFLLFGDGALTACKPISDRDLGAFLVGCLTEESRWNAVLPIGGVGPAVTPKEMGAEIFRLTGNPPKYKHVPVAMMGMIIGVLSVLGWVIPWARNKAGLARIGRYYATESMLVWDGYRYNGAATPETGNDRLFDYYADVVAGRTEVERGDHAVF